MGRMTWGLVATCAFALLQLNLLLVLPQPGPQWLAHGVMVLAPWAAALAAGWRGRLSRDPARASWYLVAWGLGLWSMGALGNLWHECVLGHQDGMYREAMLGFHLAAVPLTYLLASEWDTSGKRWMRLIDGLLALALGYAYFLVTWTALTDLGRPEEARVAAMIWLVDGQNLFIAAGAALRWHAAQDEAERNLFGALAAHAWLYLVLAGGNNHFLAGDPDVSASVSSFISVAFAVLVVMAWQPDRQAAPRHPRPGLVRLVRSASPLMVAGTLLLVSLFLIAFDYRAGATGVVVSVMGYALRNVVAQMGFIAQGEVSQRERRELESLAWTDALTGVANRRFLDHVLQGAWWREHRSSHPVAVLMIDIDHFKALNDRDGHEAGDQCLRKVAAALQSALVRPGDMLARYGGEEFVALLQETDAEGARVVAERMRAGVEHLGMQHPGSASGVVTVSIGMASAPLRDEQSSQVLIRAADKALYIAKCEGRNRVAPADWMNTTAGA